MGSHSYEDLRRHIGHKIVCVGYGATTSTLPVNVAIECEDCCEVLMDYDKPEANSEEEKARKWGEEYFECENCN